jgi:hypothetical protein
VCPDCGKSVVYRSTDPLYQGAPLRKWPLAELSEHRT